MEGNSKLLSNDKLTELVKTKGIFNWKQLTTYIRHLPYSRNASRRDFSLVLKEEKGTCSSKHALLKEIADLNAIPNIKLILGIYKMNSRNTSKIGDVLIKNNLDFIPEAHCYLKINNERIDFTSSSSDFNRIKNDILLEREIEPYEVSVFKIDFHKAFVKTWIRKQDISFSFDEVWKLREQCIANLSV